MKRFIILLSILTLTASLAKGQIIDTNVVIQKRKDLDFRIPIIKALGGNMNTEYQRKNPKNHVHIFAVIISFNIKGKIDSVYFSDNISRDQIAFIKPASAISESIKASNFEDEFKNKIVLLPIVIKRLEDVKIENLSEFLAEFTKLWPKLSSDHRAKEVVFLAPYVSWYTSIE